MKETQNVLIVGVGGQGILMASGLLAAAALEAGFDVKQSEVHGMAQRGGVVSSHVRFGSQVFSPLIPEGEADVLMAFEQAEALRWVHFLKKSSTAVINRASLVPPIAAMKGFHYPEHPIADVEKRVRKVLAIDAAAVSERLGNPRLVNTVLLGVLATSLEFPGTIWETVIRQHVPKGTESLNLQAFHAGQEFGNQSQNPALKV
jgi:indolepyruvate ferredoxin oxidoreductase beta subunit